MSFKQVLLTLTLVCLGIAVFAAQDHSSPADTTAITIDDMVITSAEVDRQARLMSAEMEKAGRPVPEQYQSMLKQRAADTLVQLRLMAREAKKLDLKVSDEDLKSQMDLVVKHFGSKEALEGFLKSADVTMDFFTDYVRNNTLVDKYFQKVFEDVKQPTDEELKTFYENNPKQFMQPDRLRASHILLKVEEGISDEEIATVQKNAEKALKRVKSGEDFAAVATEISECPSASRGGDLGYFTRGQMVPAFEAAAFALKPGEISDLVRTKFGFHVIKSVDHQPESQMSFEEVKDRLKDSLFNKDKKEKAMEAIKKATDSSKIEYVDPSLQPKQSAMQHP